MRKRLRTVSSSKTHDLIYGETIIKIHKLSGGKLKRAKNALTIQKSVPGRKENITYFYLGDYQQKVCQMAIAEIVGLVDDDTEQVIDWDKLNKEQREQVINNLPDEIWNDVVEKSGAKPEFLKQQEEQKEIEIKN